MIDLHEISNYVIAVVTGWVGYIHTELRNRPTREEVILRLENIETKLDHTQESLSELKEDLKSTRKELDN